MASGVSKRSYLEGSHCRPARLVTKFPVWVLPTRVSAGVCAEFSQGEGRKGRQEWQALGNGSDCVVVSVNSIAKPGLHNFGNSSKENIYQTKYNKNTQGCQCKWRQNSGRLGEEDFRFDARWVKRCLRIFTLSWFNLSTGTGKASLRNLLSVTSALSRQKQLCFFIRRYFNPLGRLTFTLG